jgi:ribosomal protein L37E
MQKSVSIYEDSPLFKLKEIVTGDETMGLSNKDLSVHLTCQKCGADRYAKTSNGSRNKCLLCKRVWDQETGAIDESKATEVKPKEIEDNRKKIMTQIEAAKKEYELQAIKKTEVKVAKAEAIASKLPVKKAGWKGVDGEFFEGLTKAVGSVSRAKAHGNINEGSDVEFSDDEDYTAPPAVPKRTKKPVEPESDVEVQEVSDVVKEFMVLIAEQNALIAKQNALIQKLLKQ